MPHSIYCGLNFYLFFFILIFIINKLKGIGIEPTMELSVESTAQYHIPTMIILPVK